MKIVICGSMTSSKEMLDIKRRLEARGFNVVVPEFTSEYAKMNSISKLVTESARNKSEHDLIRGYFNEIKNADAVLIANIEKNCVSGYVGGNSLMEMGFAFVLNKKIYLLNEIPDLSYNDEIKAMDPEVLMGDLTKVTVI